MSMQTYPFEEKAALVIDHLMAAAVILSDSFRCDPDMLEPGIRAALESGVPAWQAASDPANKPWLEDNDYFNISDAHDILENAGVDPLVHCSEFDGDAGPADGFENVPGAMAASGHWEDDFACFVTPERGSGLFKAAYSSPQELLGEYEEKMAPFLGAGFDYARHVADVTGTYFA